MLNCHECKIDLDESGVHVFYEARQHMTLDGVVLECDNGEYDEALDAECAKCGSNVRDLLEKERPDFMYFNRTDYSKN